MTNERLVDDNVAKGSNIVLVGRPADIAADADRRPILHHHIDAWNALKLRTQFGDACELLEVAEKSR